MLAPPVETLEQLGKHVVQSTALLPSLLAFSIGSRRSLKSWLAVQQAPPAPRIDKQVEKSLRRKLIAASIVTVCAILGLELYLFSLGNKRTIDRFFIGLFGYIFEVSLIGLFFEFTQAVEWAAHRGAAGVLHFRPRKIEKARALVSVAAATALNVAHYYGASWACGSAVVVAVVVSRLGNAPGKKFSLRASIFTLLGFVAALTVLSGVVVTIVLKMDHTDGDNSGSQTPDEIEFVGFASPHVMRFIEPFMQGIYSLFPGVLIAGCFRFDYSNAIEASPDTFAPVALESVEAPPCKMQFLSSGIVVPSTAPNDFPKPYFHAALWSWLLAQLSTVGLFALALPVPRALFEAGTFTVLSFFLSAIFIVVGVVLAAVCKGEAKKMWTYSEVWIPSPEKGIVLEGDEGVASVVESEEVLPAYQVEADGDVKQPLVAAQATDSKV